MRVTFLDGPGLAGKLGDLARECTQLDIAMAYVKIGGLRTLMKKIKVLTENGVPVRIVFGLSSRHGITDKESAEELLRLSREKKAIVRKWNNCGFHPKLMVFHGNPTSLIVGSSNLTEAAQSTNAEANILVEDVDPEVKDAALKFFEQYFDTAPTLRASDVSKYKPRSYEQQATTHPGSREDSLPSPSQTRDSLEAFRPKAIWKIAPGEHARYWRSEWLKQIDDDGEGYVAIGWDRAGNLDDFTSYDSLLKAIRHAAESYWDVGATRKTNVKYATDQVWTFKTSISPGDAFIVYSMGRVLGMAQATPDSRCQYWAVKEPDMSYGYQMNVRYLWYSPWPEKADYKVMSALGGPPIDTLRKVDAWVWEYLVKKLP